MICSTRVLSHLNPPEFTHLFKFSAHRSPIPTNKYFAGISFITTPSIDRRRKIVQFSTTMEPDRQPLPASDAPQPDDFIHVQDLSSSEMKIDEEGENSNSQTSESPNSNLEHFVERAGTSDAFASDDVSANTENEGAGAEASPTLETEEDKGFLEEVFKSVVLLECESSVEGGSCDVYLVGTAHVSQESCREVQAVISYLKPQVVFLELCSSRVAMLTPQNIEVPTIAEMMHMWKKRNMNFFGILYSWFLAKVASKLEVFPGSEFRVAYEEAMKYGGKVILGDRPVHITLRRTWGKMKMWHKVKFLYSVLFQAMFLPSPADLNKMLKEMNDVDMLTLVVQEMSKAFPTMMETLLYERDLYMSSTLLKVAREHTSVVAVVGKGHLQGIKKHWKQPVQVKELLTIPESSGVTARKILTSLGVTVAGLAIVTGIYLGGKRFLVLVRGESTKEENVAEYVARITAGAEASISHLLLRFDGSFLMILGSRTSYFQLGRVMRPHLKCHV